MMTVDVIFIPVCLWCAYVLRLAEWWPSEYLVPQWWFFPVSSILGVAIFNYNRIYRSVLRYIGSDALIQILKSILLLSLSVMIVGVFATDPIMPRSVPMLFAFVCTAYVSATRYLYRYYYQWALSSMMNKQSVAIYGAGGAGVQLATALGDSEEFKAVAFIDDDENLQGAFVQGLKVYKPSTLVEMTDSFRIKHVLLALPSATEEQRSCIVDRLVKANISALTIPAMSEIVTGRARIDTLREVEIKDLLGREAIVPDKKLLTASLLDKSVLVTGAGGSIGSEICRQILRNKPRKLILLEASEFNLYSVERELEELNLTLGYGVEIVPILGTICDKKHVFKVISVFGVHTIYHAAAYKHVPMVEKNIFVAIRNNIFGTQVVCDCAARLGVERFILISSDKAVRTTNIMGATKRFAELIVQEMASRSQQTIFTIVRFGNVLGSSGSVVPLFRGQIEKGGPVTVTDPFMTRYFMTISEAALLVIQAGGMASGGDVFVLEMGRKVKIVDLARRMIELSGHSVRDTDNPSGDIEITFIGMRPGEKITEELVIGEKISGTMHPHILKAIEDFPSSQELTLKLGDLEEACNQYDLNRTIKILSDPIVGYHQKSDIVDCLGTSCEH